MWRFVVVCLMILAGACGCRPCSGCDDEQNAVDNIGQPFVLTNGQLDYRDSRQTNLFISESDGIRVVFISDPCCIRDLGNRFHVTVSKMAVDGWRLDRHSVKIAGGDEIWLYAMFVKDDSRGVDVPLGETNMPSELIMNNGQGG